ncbi:MAG: amino acid ABC transporter permease [Clostridiales bacterium]|nr:amino acid ABC transporter permease [Candidatus Crickella merdequi]
MEYFSLILPSLLRGTVISIELFVATLIFALPLGLPIALGENSKVAPVRWFCKGFVYVFRGTPLMLQLFFFYFFFPIYLNIRWNAFPVAVLTFVLNYSAYFAEIYRGGIKSIGAGQYEAAHSLGLSKWQTFKDVVLPQMTRIVIPPVSNEVITLVKDTALASCIALADLMRVAQSTVNRDGTLTAYIIAAGIYLIFTAIATVVLGKMEDRYSKYEEVA